MFCENVHCLDFDSVKIGTLRSTILTLYRLVQLVQLF